MEPNHTDIWDAVVVGGGIMGSATAYTLVKEGKSVLLLDQFPLPHTRGSSHGASRIIRIAYEEDFQSAVMPAAFQLWKDLEKESNKTLIKKTGLLVLGSLSNGKSDVDDCAKNLSKEINEPVRIMDSKEMALMFPLMQFPSDTVGLLEKGAGILYADRATAAYRERFLARGGVIRDTEAVVNIVPGDLVTVTTNKDQYNTKSLALCCGAWSCELLAGLGINLPLQCHAVQVIYWKDKGVPHVDLPAFISACGVYGLPCNEYPGLMKVTFHGGVPSNPNTRDQVNPKHEAELVARVKKFVSQRFPFLVPEPAIIERCMYTMTPDHLCVVDQHPTYRNIAYTSGCCGTGFKMAPVIATMLADMVSKRRIRYHVKEFRASRFNAVAKL